MPEEIHWGRRGLIQVATKPVPPPPTPSARPSPMHALIACGTCGARVDESCRTVNGHTTKPHEGRVAPRLCPCGAPLAYRKRYCTPCRDRIDKENRYAGVLRHRARPKEVA